LVNYRAILPVDHSSGGTGQSLVVRHHDDRGAVGVQPSEQLYDLFARPRIQLPRRLVGQKQCGAIGPRSRDCHPLLRAAGELRGAVMLEALQP
jgi:hypothetical protein